jgi:hypothetical protein
LVAVAVMPVFKVSKVSREALGTFLPGLSATRPVLTLFFALFLPGLDADVGIGPGVLTLDVSESRSPALTGDSRSLSPGSDVPVPVTVPVVIIVE